MRILAVWTRSSRARRSELSASTAEEEDTEERAGEACRERLLSSSSELFISNETLRCGRNCALRCSALSASASEHSLDVE